MGRYRVHQFDDEDDDDDDDDEYDDYGGHGRSMPMDMDWTVIPNDDENDHASGRDVNAAYRDFIPSPPPIDDDEEVDCITNGNLRRWDGMKDEDYLEQRYFEQRYLQLNHYVPTRKRIRIRTILFIVVALLVAIIAIALKRYAPPPPQTSLFTIVPPLTLSTDSDDGVTTTRARAASDLLHLHQGDVAHYATWGDYSRHLCNALHHAMTHVLSVAWYAISNSIRSAYRDVKVGWNELFSKFGLGVSDASTSTDERKWSIALKSIFRSIILDLSNWLSQIQAMGIVLGDNLQRATHDFQQEQHEGGGLGGLALLFSKYGWNVSAGERKWSTKLEKVVQSSTAPFNTWWTQMQMTEVDRGGSSHRAEHDIQHHEAEAIDDKVSACPIRVPAASNRFVQLTGPDASANHHHHWSTEDHLRQTIGTSLSPQNLALKIIAERMDMWGNDLVKVASVPLLRNMSSAVASVRTNDDKMGFLIDKETLSEWILPPAIGFLVVGNAGVGKTTIARRLAHFLLGHCPDEKASSNHQDELDGVLEVGMSESDNNHPIHERAQSIKELIVNHIHRREGLGSVVILRHVESMHTSIVTEILQILHGTSHSLHYQTSDNELVEANCNGTVFVMTSKVWGTNGILRHLEQGYSWNVLRSREALTSSIHQEVDSYLESFSIIANPTTVVPILPFQPDDLTSILQSRVQALSVRYQEIVWKRIEVSLATIRYFVGVDKMQYSDLHTVHDDHFTISDLGAHALDDNVLLQTLEGMSKPDVQKHPDMILRISLDESTGNEVTFRWCHTVNGVEGCEGHCM